MTLPKASQKPFFTFPEQSSCEINLKTKNLKNLFSLRVSENATVYERISCLRIGNRNNLFICDNSLQFDNLFWDKGII